MPYTLTMGLVWVLLAALVGLVVGWLLRSVGARRQVERARSANLSASDSEELDRLRARVATLESVVTERDRLQIELENERAAPTAVGEATPGDGSASAASVLGRDVVTDDLTAIVGIDDDVAARCRRVGITTWAEMSVTEPSLLRTMLQEAGIDLDPASWPQQAQLLAAGDWAALAALVPTLDPSNVAE